MAKKKSKSCSCTTIISWIVTTIAIAFLFAGRFYVRLYSILPPYSLVATGVVIAISILVQLYLCCKPHKPDLEKPKLNTDNVGGSDSLARLVLELEQKRTELELQKLAQSNHTSVNPPDTNSNTKINPPPEISNSKIQDKPKPIIDIVETEYLVESKDADVKKPEQQDTKKFAFWTYTKAMYFLDAEGELQPYTFEDEEIYRDTEIDDSSRLEEYKIDPSTSKPIVEFQEVDKCYFNHYDVYYTVILLNPSDNPVTQWNIIQLEGNITKCEHSTVLGHDVFRITYYYQDFERFSKACASVELSSKPNESMFIEAEYGCITNKPLHPTCQFISFKQNPYTNLLAIADSFPVLSKYIDEVKEYRKNDS